MKTIMSAFLVTLLLISVNVFAASSNSKEMKEVLGSYLRIQEALAADSLDQVQVEAARIAKRASNPQIKASAESLSHDTKLDAARSDFKRLSAAMDKWATSAKPGGVQRMSCSMAKASWLQKPDEAKNPYYGKQMQSCGEIQK